MDIFFFGINFAKIYWIEFTILTVQSFHYVFLIGQVLNKNMQHYCTNPAFADFPILQFYNVTSNENIEGNGRIKV